MGPNLSAELSRLHQLDLLRQAEHMRLATQALTPVAGVLAADGGLMRLKRAVLSACEPLLEVPAQLSGTAGTVHSR